MNYAKGSCYCQKVKFQVAMPPSWGGHCHCHQCQKLHGAAFVTWIGFETNDFKIIDPKNKFKIFDKGNADIGFCTNCGSTFYFKYNKGCPKPVWRKSVYFARPNIHTKIVYKPTKHIYYNSRAPWFKFKDNLPKRKN